jgi:hypothetical protein
VIPQFKIEDRRNDKETHSHKLLVEFIEEAAGVEGCHFIRLGTHGKLRTLMRFCNIHEEK